MEKRERTLDKEQDDELRVFKKFAQICPYLINLESIEKRNPPEPHFLCRLTDATATAFEIVECVDDYLATSIWNCFHTARVFYDAIEKLPDDEKHRVKTKFGDVSIKIVFDEDMEWIERRSLIEPIFKQLWTVGNEKKIEKWGKSFSFLSPEEFKEFCKILEKENITEGELLKREPFSKSATRKFYLKLPKNLRPFVKRIRVMFPGLANGPHFDIVDPVWSTHPIEKRIGKKIKKKYRTKFRTELLVYYEIAPELPAEGWIVPTMDSITDKIGNTIFKRIWLYSLTEDKIIDVFPDYVE